MVSRVNLGTKLGLGNVCTGNRWGERVLVSVLYTKPKKYLSEFWDGVVCFVSTQNTANYHPLLAYH